MRYQTQFLLSAMGAAQFPKSHAPEIAFLGRSNVGKSSLLNALAGEKAAKVSSTPGRTRAINFFALSEAREGKAPAPPRLVFADLPGYGYAKISKSISSTWPAFIEPYLAEREQLKLCICLIDSNIPPQESDKQLQEWLRHMGRSFAVVGTKVDKQSGNERTRSLGTLKRAFGTDDLLLLSSKTGYGLKELWARIETAAE
jgi:GTP-binding protein